MRKSTQVSRMPLPFTKDSLPPMRVINEPKKHVRIMIYFGYFFEEPRSDKPDSGINLGISG